MTTTKNEPVAHTTAGEPHLLKRWLRKHVWTRDEARWLFAGFEPDDTRWNPRDGFLFFLDGIADDTHPRWKQNLDDMFTLADIDAHLPLDEIRTPAEWVSWFADLDFTPHWLDWARAQGLVTAADDALKTAPVKRDADTPAGVPSKMLAGAFAGLYNWDRDTWARTLGDPPEWLKKTRLTIGKRGAAPATWNPVGVAIAIHGKGVRLPLLDEAFKRQALKAWAGEWNIRTELLRD